MAFSMTKNTIRGGGSTVPYAAYTLDTVHTVDTRDNSMYDYILYCKKN